MATAMTIFFRWFVQVNNPNADVGVTTLTVVGVTVFMSALFNIDMRTQQSLEEPFEYFCEHTYLMLILIPSKDLRWTSHPQQV